MEDCRLLIADAIHPLIPSSCHPVNGARGRAGWAASGAAERDLTAQAVPPAQPKAGMAQPSTFGLGKVGSSVCIGRTWF